MRRAFAGSAMTRLRAWWYMHNVSQHMRWEREDLASANANRDQAHNWIAKYNALTMPPPERTEMPKLRVVR